MKTLETERLILRAWRLDDVDDLYEYARHPDVGPAAGWEPHASKASSLDIIQSFIVNDEVWAIVDKDSGKVIGSLGLHEDRRRINPRARAMGYVLSPEYWGCGLCTEAARRAVRYAFEDMDVEVLSIYHKPENTRSRRVIEKCGFVREGTLRQATVLYDGQVFDCVCYSILKREYRPG